MNRRINPAALAEARGILGVRGMVRVTTPLRLSSVFTLGQYAGIDITGFHVVQADHSLSPSRLHRVIVHELVHAAQCEREGGWHRFVAEYDRQLADHGLNPQAVRDEAYFQAYRAIPFEREAYYVEARAAELPRLILSDDSCKVV